MLRLWDSPLSRPTIDVDLMGQDFLSQDALERIMREICEQKVPDDGCTFDSSTVRAQAIRVDDQYGGIRVEFRAHIGRMRLSMQVDAGFGDVVVPGPVPIEFPVLLGFPSPHLLAYSPESAIAEKFHAMVILDSANSRMKDFYDIWLLARTRHFEGTVLIQALHATFARRRTTLPVNVPTGLARGFAADRAKQTQWNAFVRNGRLAIDGTTFEAADPCRFKGREIHVSLAGRRSLEIGVRSWNCPGSLCRLIGKRRLLQRPPRNETFVDPRQ